MAFEYRAFISYSHRDARWARWLLGALESYRLPDSRTRGVGRVFRDRDEAGAGDLKDEIQRALAASEHLIVVASPHSARSAYVQAEIELFAELNAQRAEPGRILTLIVDGEPNVSAGTTPDPRECFAPALRGGIAKPDGTPLEPLAADARAVGDGRTRALAKLVAGLTGIRYDALVRRDLIRRRRARLAAIAASVAALAIAGGVAAVIVSGTLEQERLRVAGEAAARETRTVSAVNDAERARRLLDGGNPAAALALARQSLPLDGSIPFIPQAYDVLFRSLFDRTQEVTVDLAGYHATAPVVLPAGDGHYFIYNDSGTGTIWSAAQGVVYRRADLDWSKRPSATPDGTAIFVAGAISMQRLTLPERTWDAVDLSAVFPDLASPDHIAAIDAQSLYACRGSDLVKIAIDGELRGTVAWHVDLPAPCSALTPAPEGGLVAGLDSYAVAIDAEGVVVRAYGPAGDLLVQRVYAMADKVILSHVGGTYIYRGESNEPQVIEGRAMDYFALSPDGRWFVHTEADNRRLVINDLRDQRTTQIACVCVFVGYYGENQLMTVADRTIEAYDLETLASTGVVHIFSAPADSYAYLPADNLLMGLRQSGPESVAFLNATASPTLLVDGTTDPRIGLLGAAFAGTGSIVTHELGPDGVALGLLPIPEPGAEPDHAAARPIVQARLAAPVPLAGGRFAVLDPQEDGGGWAISVHDGDSGADLWRATTLLDPALRAGARFIGVEDETGLAVHDAVTGAMMALPETDYFNWTMADDRLAGSALRDGTAALDMLQLADGAAQRLWTQPLESGPYFMCLAPDAQRVYAVRNADGALQLEQRSTVTGELLAQLETRDTTMLEDGRIRVVFDVSCDAASLRLPGLRSQQWRWDVARGALVVEPLSGVPPRGADAPAGFANLAEIADAAIGWDDAGAWLYDPSEDRVAVAFASGGGRVARSLYLAESGHAVLGFESGRLEVWDVRHASAPMIAVDRHTAPIVALDHDPKRRLLLSADQDGTIHLWPLLEPAELAARAVP